MSDIPYSVRGGRSTTSVDGLTDTTITNLQNQQILKYDSASQKWVNAVDGGGDATISSLGDTLISNPLTNQSLVYNATVSPARWENQVTPFTQSDFTNTVSTAAAFIKHKPIISTTSSSTMVGINTGVNKEGELTAFGKGAGNTAANNHICIGAFSGNLGNTAAISIGYNTHATHAGSVVIHGKDLQGLSSSAVDAFYIDPLRTINALTETAGNMKINMYNTSTKEIFLTDNLLVPGKTKLNGTLEVSNGIGSVNQVLTSNNTGALTWTDKSQLSSNIYDLGGLTWSGVSDNELIRRTSSTTADGTGMTITDINNLTDNKKTVSFFNRLSPLNVPLGLIDYSFNISSTVYKTHLSPKSSHATTSNGLFLQATSTLDAVKVGINVSSPSQALQVGTTMYVNDSNGKVGIGIALPTSQLEINGDLQIDSSVEARLKFYHSGSSAHTLSEITAKQDPVGGNGGDLHFYTKVDGGNVTEKLRIDNIGAIGLLGANYGTAGQFLKSNGSGSAVSWGDALTGQDAPLYVNSNGKVGIGIALPTSQLEINGDLQIDSSVEARLKFYHSGSSAHTLSEITAEKDGTNGGDLRFYTKVNNGNVTEKLRINNIGAIGLGATPTYGTAGQFLKSNNSGSAVSWDTPTDTTYTNGTGVSISASNAISIGQMVGTFDSPSFNTLTLGNGGANLGVINIRDTTNTGIASVAQMRGILDGSNGGQLEFYTKIDGGAMTRKMAITQSGTLLLDGDSVGSATIRITSADRTSQLSYIYNSTSGTKDLSIDSYSGVTSKGIRFQTQGVQRMRIGSSGELGFGATNDTGSANQVLQSNGSTLPPSWVTPSTGGSSVYGGSKVSQTGINGSIYLSSYTALVYSGIAINTPNLFIAQHDGWYNMSWSLDARSAGAAYNFRYMYLNIYKNGVLYHESIFADDLGVTADKLQGITNGGSVLIELAAADYITLQVVSDSTNFGITGYTQINKIDTTAPAPTPTNYSTNSKVFMRLNATPQSGSATEVTINSWNTTGIISNPAGLYQSSTNIFRPPRNGYYSINFQTSLKSTTNNSVNALVKLYQTDLYGTLQLVSQSQEQESNDTAIGNTKYRFLNMNIILFVYNTDSLHISIQADGSYQMPASPFTNLSIHNVD